MYSHQPLKVLQSHNLLSFHLWSLSLVVLGLKFEFYGSKSSLGTLASVHRTHLHQTHYSGGTDRGHPLVLVRVPVLFLVVFVFLCFSLIILGFALDCRV